MKKQLFIISAFLIGSFALISMTVLHSSFQEPWIAPAKYIKMENPFADVADDEKIGRTLYSKHCKSCHGTKGKGDGTKADTIDTEVGDFSEDYFKEQTDGSLYYKAFIGRDDMPSFKKKITDEKDKWMIVNYIKKF